MSTTEVNATEVSGAGRCPFPFPEAAYVDAPAEYDVLLREPGLRAVQLSNGHPALLISRYDEVTAALSDDRFSRSGFVGTPLFARSADSLPLITADPPVHSRRRAAVLSPFTARRVRRLEPRLAELAGNLLADMAARTPPRDLVAEFTLPFALRIITEMLGVPAADEQWLCPLVDTMMSTTRFERTEIANAHAEAASYFGDLVTRRQRELESGAPGDDVITELLSAPERRRLSDSEIATFGAGLLMAGYETTRNQLAMCVLLLLDDPAWAQRLRAEPAGIPAAVEEMVRWSALNATGGVPHVATEDIRVGGTIVRAGQVVVPLPEAANRDPAHFPDPGRLDPDRAPTAHVGFGHGRHYCLGATLARAELRIGLHTLLSTFPGLALGVPREELSWRRGMYVRGLWSLPVTWTGGAA